MIINYLIVANDITKYKYIFAPGSNLIYSKDNSRGKTTLIRFLLYSFGYQIPATEGIGDFAKFNFELSLKNGNKEYICFRKNNNMTLKYNENITNFLLPSQENELHSILFGIGEISILQNLLSVYYIDQEKGWTMLNRGKIIGNIRFNIEEFIAGISNIDITNLLNEKNTISLELKKYRYFKNVIDIRNEYQDIDDFNNYSEINLDDLLQKQKELQLDLNKTSELRRSVSKIISDNKQFSNLLIDLGIVINHNGEEFTITENDLSDFNSNQSMLRIKENGLKLEEERLKNELKLITMSINEKNTLVSVESIVEEMEKNIDSLGIDVSKIDRIILQLNNKRNKLNDQIKEKLSFNNSQLVDFYNVIDRYAIELKIKEYISNDSPQFVLTNKLKGFSGRILAQMAFIFKLSYIKMIDNKYGLKLPIIIDSPRTNELSEESTNDMLNILRRDFNDHQIILASIYNNSILNDRIINLDNGLFSNHFTESED